MAKSPLYIKKANFSALLPVHRLEQIDAIAKDREVARSTVLLEAVREYLDRRQPIGKVRR